MKFPEIPENETERLKSLYMMDLLDKKDDERLDRLTRLAKTAFDVPIGIISLLDRDRQWLVSCSGEVKVRETSRNISFCAHAILAQGIFIVKDTSVDERFHDNPFVIGEPHIRFYAGCPVRLPDGSIAGTICIIDDKPRDFTPENINALLDLGAIVEDEFHIISMAMTDTLTELPNKRGFYKLGDKRFSWLTDNKRSFSLIYLDVENITAINEFFGHNEGDNTLKKFASVLLRCLKKNDVAARLEGGKFVILLGHADDRDVDTFLFSLQSKIDDLNEKSMKKFRLHYSYGIVEYDPDRHGNLLEMMNNSEHVMYLERKKPPLNPTQAHKSSENS